MTEIFKTKTTKLGNGIYGCRVLMADTNQLVVEVRTTKNLISSAYQDMFRTLAKLGYESKMAESSRQRRIKKGDPWHTFKFIWG